MINLRSVLSICDIQCLVAAGFFLFSNVLEFVLYFSFKNNSSFDYDGLMKLDPLTIMEMWDYRRSVASFRSFAAIVTAVAWFMLIVPAIKVAWIQSAQGSYRIGLHSMIVCLALGGSFTELIAQLLYIGSMSGMGWMSRKFPLNNWSVNAFEEIDPTANNMENKSPADDTSDDPGDMIGWKTLEVVSNALNSLMIWIDSAEWVFLSAIFVLIFISVRSTTKNSTERCHKNREKQFSMKWAIFGLVIGILCLVNFIVVDLIVVRSHSMIDNLAFAISTTNRLALIPLWLAWLSFQLPAVEQSYEYSCIEFENTVMSYKAPKDGHPLGRNSSASHADVGDDTNDIVDPRYT
jgi:hypothetical protein